MVEVSVDCALHSALHTEVRPLSRHVPITTNHALRLTNRVTGAAVVVHASEDRDGFLALSITEPVKATVTFRRSRWKVRYDCTLEDDSHAAVHHA